MDQFEHVLRNGGKHRAGSQEHGLISAKIASTVHDPFHALMLVELDRNGKTAPGFFGKISLRLPQSVTARNALGNGCKQYDRCDFTSCGGPKKAE
jgi:hypothetical protein